MTLYTDETLTEWYEDDDGVTDFVDDDGETVIIVGLSGEEPEPPVPGGTPLIMGQICT